MAEHLSILPSFSKEELYENLLPQLEGLLGGETDTIANFANITAALRMTFNFFWVGFYIVKKDELVLGPFQGTVACSRIKYGKGVCGTAWKEKRPVIVPNVNEFAGHIACDSASLSEIVIPIFLNNEVIAVLDIDSDKIDQFDKTDEKYLCRITGLIEKKLF